MKELPLCQLCKMKPANQTGSHIFSWFLIRDCINKKGIKRRHNEITFGISSESFVETYIGSEIQPEEILKIKGRDLTDDEIDQLKHSNPFTADHILCSECEKKLSVLESEIEKKVFATIRSYGVIKTDSFDLITTNHGGLMRLFIYSLAWRAAIVRQNNFSMDENHKEVLRKILNNNLNLDVNTLEKNATSNISEITKLPIIITLSEVKGENDNYVYCALTSKPYGMILNDLSFQLFFKESHTKMLDRLQGINDILRKKDVINYQEEKFKIVVLSNACRLKINQNLSSYFSDKILRSGTSKFRDGFKYIFGKRAPAGLVNYFKYKVALHGNPQIENFTTTHFFNAAVEVMTEYCKSVGIRIVK